MAACRCLSEKKKIGRARRVAREEELRPMHSAHDTLLVQLCHLKTHEAMNGTIGRLVGWHGGTLRFLVHIGERRVLVRAANMRIVADGSVPA